MQRATPLAGDRFRELRLGYPDRFPEHLHIFADHLVEVVCVFHVGRRYNVLVSLAMYDLVLHGLV